LDLFGEHLLGLRELGEVLVVLDPGAGSRHAAIHGNLFAQALYLRFFIDGREACQAGLGDEMFGLPGVVELGKILPWMGLDIKGVNGVIGIDELFRRNLWSRKELLGTA
jgi:hypothetical protein